MMRLLRTARSGIAGGALATAIISQAGSRDRFDS